MTTPDRLQVPTAAAANGKGCKELPEIAELAHGESIDEWAERFVTIMEQREAEQEKRRSDWTPLSLIGLKVR